MKQIICPFCGSDNVLNTGTLYEKTLQEGSGGKVFKCLNKECSNPDLNKYFSIDPKIL